MRCARALADGSAAAYFAQQEARLTQLRDPAARNVVLPPIETRPPLLYNGDAGADPLNWRNNVMRVFYGKDSLTVARTTPPADPTEVTPLEGKQFQNRTWLVILVLAVLLCVFTGVLYNLQVNNMDYYRGISTRKIANRETVEAARGEILDRYGRVLVSNRPPIR